MHIYHILFKGAGRPGVQAGRGFRGSNSPFDRLVSSLISYKTCLLSASLLQLQLSLCLLSPLSTNAHWRTIAYYIHGCRCLERNLPKNFCVHLTRYYNKIPFSNFCLRHTPAVGARSDKCVWKLGESVKLVLEKFLLSLSACMRVAVVCVCVPVYLCVCVSYTALVATYLVHMSKVRQAVYSFL